MASPHLSIENNVDDMLLEAAQQKVDSQHNVIEQLDQKSSVVLGFSLVSVVEVLGFLLLVAADHTQPARSEPFWVHLVFFLALTFVLAGSFTGLFALRGNSSHCFHASDFGNLRRHSGDKAQLVNALLNGVESAICRNYEVIRHKRRELRAASILIGGSLVLYAVLVLHIFSSRF